MKLEKNSLFQLSVKSVQEVELQKYKHQRNFAIKMFLYVSVHPNYKTIHALLSLVVSNHADSFSFICMIID